MQHAKKMVLMPQDAIPTREHIEQAKSVQTPGTTLTRLDAEMDEIFRSVTPSNEREKWKLYQQVLQRYQFYVDEERRAKPAAIDPPRDEPAAVNEEEENGESLTVPDKDIIATVPRSYKKQAEQFLKHLHTAANSRVTWDKSGLVFINGKPIKNSNIADLVNEVMRNRKTVRAEGREQFGSELRLMGVPRELIGNSSLLYENLTLTGAGNTSWSASIASPSNADSPNTSLNSSTGSQRRRTPTSATLRSWKKLNL